MKTEAIYAENQSQRAKRRKDNYKKAIRKRNIHEAKFAKKDGEKYECLGKYIKGKIHCSCLWCSVKTNTKGTWNKGKKNYKISDRRIVDSMNEKIKEVQNGEGD